MLAVKNLPLGPQAQLFTVLCVAQAACLASGLWINDRLNSAVNQNREGNSAAVAVQDGTGRRAHDRVPVGADAQRGSSAPPTSIGGGLESKLLTGLSFLWINSLQSLFAWLLLHRVRGQQSRREQQSKEETLLTAKELVRTRDAVIFGLAKLAESRDPDTGHHLERIALYATRLAYALRRQPKYRDAVSLSFVRMIGIGSALHDIGKVGIEDSILLKPGRLTDEERVRIQTHTKLGGDCIRQIEQQLGQEANFLQMAREIAYFHHEWWDGSGYPQGLQGEQIPLAARIVAIADVYDALAVKRVYKDAYPHEACVERIRELAGRQFDPNLVEVFLAIHHQFREIAQSYSETGCEVALAGAVSAATTCPLPSVETPPGPGKHQTSDVPQQRLETSFPKSPTGQTPESAA